MCVWPYGSIDAEAGVSFTKKKKTLTHVTDCLVVLTVTHCVFVYAKGVVGGEVKVAGLWRSDDMTTTLVRYLWYASLLGGVYC